MGLNITPTQAGLIALNPVIGLNLVGAQALTKKAGDKLAGSMPGRRIVELSPEEKALEDALYKDSQLSEEDLLKQAREGVPEIQQGIIGDLPKALEASQSQLGGSLPGGFSEALSNRTRRISNSDLSKSFEAQRLAATQQRANRLGQSAGVITASQNMQMENAMRRAQAVAAQQQARQALVKGLLGAGGNIIGASAAKPASGPSYSTPQYGNQSLNKAPTQGTQQQASYNYGRQYG